MSHLSASFSATLRVRLDDRPGAFAELARVIADTGASLEAIDLVRSEPGVKVRDVTVLARDAEHIAAVAAAAEELASVEVEHVSDRTFLMHLGGKIEMALKAPLVTRDDLSMAYTPGVARVSEAIADDPEKAWSLTIKRNTVAVVSDGTAVLGLGDIGPEAAMPVMEGKAMLLKEFAGVDGWPVCLATTDVDEIVAAVTAIAPGLRRDQPGGHLGAPVLRDRGAPPRSRSTSPSSTTTSTALRSSSTPRSSTRCASSASGPRTSRSSSPGSAPRASRRRGSCSTPVSGTSSAAIGPVRSTRAGRVSTGSRRTTRRRPTRTVSAGRRTRCSRGADVYIGLSQPGAVSFDGIRSMADDAIVFAMANPTPEVAPDELEGLAAVVATGRSDYPNQINNVLAFPGVFRGALDVRARDITEGMKFAAGEAIAGVVAPDELGPEYIVPSVFNREVVRVVASAVAEAAERDGVARRLREPAVGQR